jgi:putative membrane protein
MLLPGIPVAIFFALSGYFWLNWYAVIFLLFLPYFFLSGLWFKKNFRLYISVDAMQLLSGVWGREIKIVKWQKIQLVDLRQSIYQRSAGLATIKLITAAGIITVPYVSLPLAEAIRNYALYRVESSNEPWM